MKTVLVASIFSLAMLNHSFATGASSVKKELDEAIKFENNSLSIEKNRTAFVKVSFKVNDQGKIEVLDSNYSDRSIKQQLMEKLAEITLSNQHDVNKVYYYNFTFKKM
jgi:hypothetical protein